MKLTLDDVKKITAGALEITEEDGMFSFCRFEKGAKDYYPPLFQAKNPGPDSGAPWHLSGTGFKD